MARQRSIRHSRKDVAARTQAEFDLLDALVKRIRPDQWQLPVPRPETRAPWTIKDALAHIVYWKVHTARTFRGERRPPELRGLDVQDINTRVYEEWRDRRSQAVVAWHREVHADVMRTLADIPDEKFTSREHGPDWPGDFTSHSAAHRLKDIEAALGTPSSSST